MVDSESRPELLPPGGRRSGRVFVGRQREMAELTAALDHALFGHGAVELTGKVDNHLAESLAHHWVWFSLGALGQDSEGARRHAMAAMAAAERLHDRSLLARTLVNLCNLFSAWGDWQTARQFSDRGLALAPQSAFPVRTLLEYQIGDFERGEWYLGRDQEVVGLTDHRTSPRRASIVLTTVARMTGVSESLDTAKATAEAVLSSSSATPFYTYAANISLDLFVKTPRQPGARWG